MKLHLMQQTLITLSDDDRRELESFRSNGRHHSREVNRAHILLGLSREIAEKSLMEVLGIGRTAIWRTRAAYNEGGWKYAVTDLPRSGQPKKYRTDEEAIVVALACSQPPQGFKRWTVKSLTQGARQQVSKLKTINRESVRKILKKTRSNLGAK